MPHEVFLSYSHDDNGFPLKWVEALHERLEAAVRVRRPPFQFRVFRDPEIRRCENFDDRIKQEVSAAHVMLCVSSPAYNDSRYCGEEREYFLQTRSFGMNGLVNVQKEPMSVLDQPEPFQLMLGHKFHDPKTKQVFDAADPRFERAVVPLADELLGMVKAGLAPKPRVLLLASEDREEERERLANDLAAEGIEIVPSPRNPLPRADRSRDDQLKTWAAGAPGDAQQIATFTVLLLGNTFSDTVALVFDELAKKYTSGVRRCLLGMPPISAPLDPEQREFRKLVKRSSEAFDFCSGPEDLRPETLRFLAELRDQAKRTPTLFLSYLKTSRAHADTLRRAIANLSTPPDGSGAEGAANYALRVLDPYGDGDGTQLRTQTQARDEVLKASHGAILVVDRGDATIHNLLADADGPIPKDFIGIYVPDSKVRLSEAVLEPYRFLQPEGTARYDWLPRSVRYGSLDTFLKSVRARANG